MQQPARSLSPAARAVALAAALAVSRAAPAQHPSVPPPPPCRAPSFASDELARLIAAEPQPAVIVGTFRDESGHDDEGVLGPAITQRIVARLRSASSLVVVAQRDVPQDITPEQRFTPTASRGVLDGRVRRDGDRVQVTITFTPRGEQSPAWSAIQTASVDELPGLESRLVGYTLTRMQVRPLARPRTRVTTQRPRGDAYDHFLRASYLRGESWGESGLVSAIDEYESAVQADPDFVEALADLGSAYGELLYWGWHYPNRTPDQLLVRGLQAEDQALRRDSSVAEAWLGRGLLLAYRNPATFAGVREALRRAMRLDPTSGRAERWYSRMLMELGDESGAEAMLRRSLAVAPSAEALYDLGELRLRGRRYGSACALLNQAIRIDPRIAHAYVARALARMQLDELRDAWADAEIASRLGARTWGEAVGAVIDARARDTTRARARLKPLVASTMGGDSISPWSGRYLGIALAAIRDGEHALDVLERIRPRGALLATVLRDPGFDALRSSSRFRRLVALASSRSGSSTAPVDGSASSAARGRP